MITLTKEWLLKTIAELEEERDATPGAVNEDAVMALEAMKLALASLEADGTLTGEGTITATQFKPVADLYEVTVPSGRSTTFTKDAAEASDCRVMGWSVQEYVKLERYQAAVLQDADGNSPVIPDRWVACSERMPDIGTEIFYFCQDDDLRNCGIVSSANFSGRGDAQLYVHADGYELRFGVDITHWMPLPAAPQHG